MISPTETTYPPVDSEALELDDAERIALKAAFAAVLAFAIPKLRKIKGAATVDRVLEMKDADIMASFYLRQKVLRIAITYDSERLSVMECQLHDGPRGKPS